MASHHLTIAKASLVAACLRPDVSSLSRNEVNDFQDLFEVAFNKCSVVNIQKCKNWLLVHVVPSSHRTAALGKYMSSISKHLSVDGTKTSKSKPSPNRKRLHILYLINDLLHHVHYHVNNLDEQKSFAGGLQPVLPELFQLAISDAGPRICQRLKDLLKIWEYHNYVNEVTLKDIDAIVVQGRNLASLRETSNSSHPVRELPFIMPATHGDPLSPFHDLPAANLMPHIVPNSSMPMRPDQIRALRLTSGPADETLVEAVKAFLQESKSLEYPFSAFEENKHAANMDELGQVSYKNDDEQLIVETYYGWSRVFCDKMRSRGKGASDHRRRSRSRGSDTSANLGPSKRPRNDSSRSRSSSPRSRQSRSYSPEGGYSDFARGGSLAVPRQMEHDYRMMNTSLTSQRQHFVPPAPTTVGPSQLPIPPPKPPNWNGPWPPPPPPLPAFPGNTFLPMGFLPPPPF